MLFNPKWTTEYANPDAVSVLTDARSMIATPQTWSSFGMGDHVKRCAMMALWGAIGVSDERGYIDPSSVAYLAMAVGKGYRVYNSDIGNWNDTSTHDEVMAGMDQAIELAKWVPADVA